MAIRDGRKTTDNFEILYSLYLLQELHTKIDQLVYVVWLFH